MYIVTLILDLNFPSTSVQYDASHLMKVPFFTLKKEISENFLYYLLSIVY